MDGPGKEPATAKIERDGSALVPALLKTDVTAVGTLLIDECKEVTDPLDLHHIIEPATAAKLDGVHVNVIIPVDPVDVKAIV